MFIICSLVVGFIITLAEPDLVVLANQVSSINKWVFIVAVAVGVSIFLMLGILRIIFQMNIKLILMIAYGIVLVLMFFVPPALLPVTIDSGSVTTGAISVPFLISFGIGISTVMASKNSKDDSFGLIALISVGPIIVT
jgi:hypothetical protein